VKISSRPGHGTTISVYLPRYLGAEVDWPVPAPPVAPPAAGEKILVVEDEARVRSTTAEMLREIGYQAVEADGAAGALALIEQQPDIALLFTDIVMPGGNGRELAEAAIRSRPGLKVLFTTGYTRNAIVHNGILDAGVHVIMKPYGIDALAAKLREVLGADAMADNGK
jgi:CheY-like chemotaxis protein